MLFPRAVALSVVALVPLASARAQSPTAASSPAPAGRSLYLAECAGCHGVNGDGKGQADPALTRQPRDFTRGKFKFRSTDTQKAISDDELFQTITTGIAGTAMPSFRYLSADDRRQLVGYVRYLAHLQGVEAGTPIAVAGPPAATPELVAHGRELYARLGCPVCHGPEGRGDGPAATALKDESGAPDPPPDLTRAPYPGGDSAKDVYLRVTLGVPGTPMPGYAEVASDAERWAVVAYLDSIRQPPPPPPRDRVERGKLVMERYHCLACHQLKGAGGQIGPALDTTAQKLRPEALRAYLADPRAQASTGTTSRMPQQFHQPDEIDAVVAYLTAVGPPPVH